MKINIANIQPNPYNPNKMTEGVFKKLKLSIQKFGLLNAIVVRKKEKGYEIIDGEWRWRACKELNFTEIPCNVIEATDEEVKQIIFASTIRGKHDAYESQEVLRDFVDTTNGDTLKACNLDKLKLERKTKYMNFDKAKRMQKGKKRLKEEQIGLPNTEDYKCILAIPLNNKDYNSVLNRLQKINKDLGKALLQILEGVV